MTNFFYRIRFKKQNCMLISISKKKVQKKYFNPLPSGTLATFFLTAIGQIKHTEEGHISREKDDSDDVTAAWEGRRR